MDPTGFVTLSRQSGLMREMQVVANNIANAATTGYRAEGVIFSEHVRAAPGAEPVSMGRARVRDTSMMQGALVPTGGVFDLAIEGDGFFLVETPAGERLTRAGNFSSNAAGDLVTPDGHRVLDEGGAPVFVLPDVGEVLVGADGTISAGGRILGQIGVVVPADPAGLTREGGVLFHAEAGTEAAPQAQVLQRVLEQSNVNAVGQLARMVEIQRAYELGQSFLETEDQRIRDTVKTLIR